MMTNDKLSDQQFSVQSLSRFELKYSEKMFCLLLFYHRNRTLRCTAV